MNAKRVMDLVLTIPAIIVLLPVFFGIMIWVKLDSKGSAFFVQTRVGKNGQPFRMIKFRTMSTGESSVGSMLTIENDPRITAAGKVLRKCKLDELPQLINIVRGEMSIVGPRPEVPEYVELYTEVDKHLVFSVRPGITDVAAIEFMNEGKILSKAENPHDIYRDELLPVKIRHYKEYIKNQSIWTDFVLILQTLRALSRQ